VVLKCTLAFNDVAFTIMQHVIMYMNLTKLLKSMSSSFLSTCAWCVGLVYGVCAYCF
jgi:hypothetical protein